MRLLFHIISSLILHVSPELWRCAVHGCCPQPPPPHQQPDSAGIITAPLPAPTVILLNNVEPSLLLPSHAVAAAAAVAASSTSLRHRHANSMQIGLLLANAATTGRPGCTSHPSSAGLRSLRDQLRRPGIIPSTSPLACRWQHESCS